MVRARETRLPGVKRVPRLAVSTGSRSPMNPLLTRAADGGGDEGRANGPFAPIAFHAGQMFQHRRWFADFTRRCPA